MMLFSIVIPTCNRPPDLIRCLTALQNSVQPLGREEYEIIVSDDSTGNETIDMLQAHFPGVVYTRNDGRTPATNRNNGATHANGEWLVFIDDDCIPGEDLLRSYQQAIIKNPGCLAFEGAILPDDRNLLKKDLAECPVNEGGAAFWTANVMIRRQLFEALGGFDASLGISFEDSEMYYRLQKQTKVPFCANCQVVHPVRLVSLSAKLKKLLPFYNSQVKFSLRAGNTFPEFWFGVFRKAPSYLLLHLKNRHPKSLLMRSFSIFLHTIYGPVAYLKFKKEFYNHN